MGLEKDKDNLDEELIKDIARAVKGIRFGYVQLIVQDSKVVQIDKTEKIRLDRKGGNAAG